MDGKDDSWYLSCHERLHGVLGREGNRGGRVGQTCPRWQVWHGLVVGMGNGMRLHDSRVAMLLAVASLKASLRMIRLIWRSVMTYIHGR